MLGKGAGKIDEAQRGPCKIEEQRPVAKLKNQLSEAAEKPVAYVETC